MDNISLNYLGQAAKAVKWGSALQTTGVGSKDEAAPFSCTHCFFGGLKLGQNKRAKDGSLFCG